MYSAIYEGKIRHRRFHPVRNEFEYRLFMMYLDLSELDKVFNKRWFWSADKPNIAFLSSKDHLGKNDEKLDTKVGNLVYDKTGIKPEGPIRLLTHLRYFGHCFNPVSFFYCFNADDQKIQTIVAEIHNTPWLEQYCYVFPDEMNCSSDPWQRYKFNKDFHVSPFMDMDINYEWAFLKPSNRIQVHMQNFEKGKKLFDATLYLRRTEITGPALSRVLFQYPLITFQGVMKIYFQALKLRMKGAVFYPHPSKRDSGGEKNYE